MPLSDHISTQILNLLWIFLVFDTDLLFQDQCPSRPLIFKNTSGALCASHVIVLTGSVFAWWKMSGLEPEPESRAATGRDKKKGGREGWREGGGGWWGVTVASFQALEVEKAEKRKISCCFKEERRERE